jgi:hypothetical protein
MVSRFAKPQIGQTSTDSKAGEFIEYRCGVPSHAWCARTRFIQGTTEVELVQVVNKISKRESYKLEAVQYACASTGIGTSLNRFTMGHRAGCSPRNSGSASCGELHTLSQ